MLLTAKRRAQVLEQLEQLVLLCFTARPALKLEAAVVGEEDLWLVLALLLHYHLLFAPEREERLHVVEPVRRLLTDEYLVDEHIPLVLRALDRDGGGEAADPETEH